jgi:hypothetical protein
MVTTALGALLWLVGAALVISYLGTLRAGRDWNELIAFGAAGGIGAWVIWRGEDDGWRSWTRFLPVIMGFSLLSTWIGMLVFGDPLVGPSVTRGLPGIPPPTGAWFGSLIGSIAPYAVIAVYRDWWRARHGNNQPCPPRYRS